MTDLVTLEQVKQYLGITNTGTDAVLRQLISAYSEAARNYCSRDFALQTYVEPRDGNGKNRLLLISGPVQSISKVTIDQLVLNPVPTDSTTGQPSLTAAGYRQADLEYGDGRLLISNQFCFRRGSRNVVITYDAGYSITAASGPDPAYVNVPPDLAQTVAELVSLGFKSRDWIGYKSKSLAGEVVAFDTSALPNRVSMVLQRYRRTAVPL